MSTGRIVSLGSLIVIAVSTRECAGGGFNLLYAAVRQGAQADYAGTRGAGPRGVRRLLVRDAVP